MRETRKEQPMIYDEICVVCGGTFKVDTPPFLSS